MGVFTDPIRFATGDINMYRYVSNNYLNYTDLLGLQCDPRWLGNAMNSIGSFNAEEECRAHDDIYDDGLLNNSDPDYPLDLGLIQTDPYDGKKYYYPRGIGSGIGYEMGNSYSYSRSQADDMFLDSMAYNNPSTFGQAFSFLYHAIVYVFGWMFWFE